MLPLYVAPTDRVHGLAGAGSDPMTAVAAAERQTKMELDERDAPSLRTELLVWRSLHHARLAVRAATNRLDENRVCVADASAHDIPRLVSSGGNGGQ